MVAFTSRTDNTGATKTKNSFDVSSGVPTTIYESCDDEDMFTKALVEAYKLLYKK